MESGSDHSQTPMSQVAIQAAKPSQFELLARMNKELIEDEGHRNPMNVEELCQRFERFVSTEGYSLDVILWCNEVIGFATYRQEPDSAEACGYHIHLRQFYISRDVRGRGLGSLAFESLTRARFKRGERLFLNVLETNPRGKEFWKKTGFKPYDTTMEQVVQG
ncbi:GNAT family N-acetyltransferase [Paraburkholderia sartisoli]|uniref:Ribosomal protein S18 acetylase RimI n=1 Tax=Paraburkholderia sartisoli TaxID=83784 RepID=A0A1H4D2D9_9BURK|nr:GNAT family N-acetyltransferase [Paraburkholderia sartisoli]SEA66706.1 Ribosomal protein S18 acetylase RimI [Paraburkholderia sartisoli]